MFIILSAAGFKEVGEAKQISLGFTNANIIVAGNSN